MLDLAIRLGETRMTNNVETWDSEFTFTIALVLVTIALYVIWAVYALIAGRGYDDASAESDAESYGGIIQEAHGGIPAFLWITYVVLAVWTVAYLYFHRADFAAMFGG